MYRIIDSSFWIDPDIRKMDATTTYLYCYLITNPHAHMCGVYYLPMCLVQHETKLSEEEIKHGVDTLLTRCKVIYDEDCETWWIKNMASYQICNNDSWISTKKYLETIKSNNIIKSFTEKYKDKLVAQRREKVHGGGGVSTPCQQDGAPGTGTGTGTGKGEGEGEGGGTGAQPPPPPSSFTSENQNPLQELLDHHCQLFERDKKYIQDFRDIDLKRITEVYTRYGLERCKQIQIGHRQSKKDNLSFSSWPDAYPSNGDGPNWQWIDDLADSGKKQLAKDNPTQDYGFGGRRWSQSELLLMANQMHGTERSEWPEVLRRALADKPGWPWPLDEKLGDIDSCKQGVAKVKDILKQQRIEVSKDGN